MRHVCAFFSDEEEEYRVLLPFIKGGFERGDRAIHVINPGHREYHLARLSSAGIDTAGAEQKGQLDIRINDEVYLVDGRFDADRMLEAFEQDASGNADQFPLSRIICRMDWGTSLIEDLIEFESRVNNVWLRHDHAVICTYHLDKFGSDAIIEMIRTHPMLIVGGILHENPFFVPPAEFLKEYRERRS